MANAASIPAAAAPKGKQHDPHAAPPKIVAIDPPQEFVREPLVLNGRSLGWLTERQFLDAVAVAMITPGPVVITVAFIGYLAAGPVGGTLAALGTFLPCYLLVVGPAPWFRRYAQNARIRAFVDGVTAAASGAIAGAAFVLGRRAINDVPTAIIAVSTLAAMTWLKKAPEPILIVLAGGVGLLLRS